MPVAVWIRAGHDGTGTTIQIKGIIKGLKWRLVQEILICKGPWQNKFVDQCINLSLGFAIGLRVKYLLRFSGNCSGNRYCKEINR